MGLEESKAICSDTVRIGKVGRTSATTRNCNPVDVDITVCRANDEIGKCPINGIDTECGVIVSSPHIQFSHVCVKAIDVVAVDHSGVCGEIGDRSATRYTPGSIDHNIFRLQPIERQISALVDGDIGAGEVVRSHDPAAAYIQIVGNHRISVDPSYTDQVDLPVITHVESQRERIGVGKSCNFQGSKIGLQVSLSHVKSEKITDNVGVSSAVDINDVTTVGNVDHSGTLRSHGSEIEIASRVYGETTRSTHSNTVAGIGEQDVTGIGSEGKTDAILKLQQVVGQVVNCDLGAGRQLDVRTCSQSL